MAINKKLIHFNKKTTFNSQKLSANASNTQYQVGGTGTVQTGAPDINYQSIVYIKDSKEIWTHGQFYATAVTWSTITGKPSFATVATSGSYNDLNNKPTIPTKLPTPNALTFTGAVTGTWDGSSAKTVNIPSGSSYTLPLASNSTRGGIKLSSSTQGGTPNGITTTSGRTYAVQVNSSEQAVVNVPWTDTTYTLPTASASTLGGVKVGSGLSISNGVLSTSGGDVKIYETTINFEDIIGNSRTSMTSDEVTEVLNISTKLSQGYIIVTKTRGSGSDMVGSAVIVSDNAPQYSFLLGAGPSAVVILTADIGEENNWSTAYIHQNSITNGTSRVVCNSNIIVEAYGAYNTLYGTSGMTSLGKYNANSTVNTGMTRLVSIGTGTSNTNRISGLEVGQYKSNSFVALCDKTSDGCYMTMNGNTGEVHLTGYNCEMAMDTSGMQITGGADLYIDMNPRFLGGAVEIGNDNLSVGLIQYGDFNITGDITCTGAATFSSTVAAEGGFFDTSDARVKTNVKEIDASDADKVKLVEFDRTDKEHHGYGVIAQELEKVYPEMVNTDDEGFKSVNYNELAMVKIKYLEDKVARLEALVGRLLAE
jgi:hypothetical protein